MDETRELIVDETKIVMLSDKVVFSSAHHNENTIVAFYIPDQFKNCAIEFYDLYLEQGCPTVFLACRGNYDIAIHLNVQNGKMLDWHYTK